MTPPLTELMVCVADLAKATGRIPIGRCDIALDPGWDLRVNGTGETWDSLPPWTCVMNRGGLPVLMFDPFGGTTIGGPDSEALAIEMLNRHTEIANTEAVTP